GGVHCTPSAHSRPWQVQLRPVRLPPLPFLLLRHPRHRVPVDARRRIPHPGRGPPGPGRHGHVDGCGLAELRVLREVLPPAEAVLALVEKAGGRPDRAERPVRSSAMRASVFLVAVPALSACRRDKPVDRGDAGVPVTTAVKLDNFGYRPDDTKVAIFTADPGLTVEVRSPGGAVVFSVPVDGGSI